MNIQKIYNTVWEVEDVDPNTRLEAVGHPVVVNKPLLIKHSATCHYLASDLLEYRNDFGTEYEVNVHSYGTKNKSQNLALEGTGAIAGGQATKFQNEENKWTFQTASSPAQDYSIEEKTYSIEDMLNEIKAKLLSRGNYSLRGLARSFRILDDNGNHQISEFEFRNGLLDFGFALTEEQSKAMIKFFDKNNDGQVHFDEFVRFMRGEINDF